MQPGIEVAGQAFELAMGAQRGEVSDLQNIWLYEPQRLPALSS
jgi:hypothetical protein